MIDAGTMYANAKALHELLQESRAENKELRKERDALDHLTDVLNATNDGLLAENAKLRELVRRMHACLEHYEPGDTISCEQCPYDNETWGCDYERLMAELGIEVDGCPSPAR